MAVIPRELGLGFFPEAWGSDEMRRAHSISSSAVTGPLPFDDESETSEMERVNCGNSFTAPRTAVPKGGRRLRSFGEKNWETIEETTVHESKLTTSMREGFISLNATRLVMPCWARTFNNVSLWNLNKGRKGYLYTLFPYLFNLPKHNWAIFPCFGRQAANPTMNMSFHE